MNADQVLSSDRLTKMLSTWKLEVLTEDRMQACLATVFEEEAIEFAREVSLGKRDRIDFLVGSVGVECKVSGSDTEVLRQLGRYAECDRIGELLLVTSKASHRSLHGIEIVGKRISVHWQGFV